MAKVTVKDKHWRSLVKGISWRITGTVDTIIISWIVTRKLSLAFTIGFIEVFTKVGLYYFHERLWERVKIGRAYIDEEATKDGAGI
jgi:uncharacterized membrane protein